MATTDISYFNKQKMKNWHILGTSYFTFSFRHSLPGEHSKTKGTWGELEQQRIGVVEEVVVGWGWVSGCGFLEHLISDQAGGA